MTGHTVKHQKPTTDKTKLSWNINRIERNCSSLEETEKKLPRIAEQKYLTSISLDLN